MAHRGKIPGLYSSDKNLDWSSDNLEQEAQNNTNNSMNMDTSQNQDSSSVLNEIRTEKDNLGLNFVHAHRLLDAEITKLQHGSKDFTTFDSNTKQVEKIFVNLQDQKQHNLVGRLLGPKGVTLKRIQAETQTKISILGRGSMRDKKKEEELANGSEPGFEHLKEPLHVLVEASPPYSNVKLAAAVTEVRKMLIPLEPGAQDLIAAKFIDPIIGGNLPGGFREGLLPSPVEDGFSGGRGGGARGGRGGPRGGGGGARGAPSRGGPPMRGRGRGGGEPMRGRGGGPRGAGGARGGGGPRGGSGPRGGAPRGAGRGGAGERGGRGRPRGRGAGSGGGYEEGGYGSRGESGGYGGNRGDGSGGGPIRARASAASYDRMADYKPETNVGYGSDYDRGYSERDDAGYRRSDHASSAAEGDSYYSNYSESPARGYSRDYNHGSGEGEAEGSDWKPRSRSEYRHHPYQQSSGYY